MNIEINLKIISKWLLGQLKGTLKGFWNMLKAVIMTAIVGYIGVTIASVSGCTNAQGFLKSLAGEEPIEVTGSVPLDKNYTVTDSGVIQEETDLSMCLGILDNLTTVEEGSINLETVESNDVDKDLSSYIDELEDAHDYCTEQRKDADNKYIESINSKDAEITRLQEVIVTLLGGDQEKIDILFDSDSSGEDDE